MTALWYVVQTHAGREQLVARAIENIGFNTFLPVYQRKIHIGRQSELVDRPLFPMYLFASFEAQGASWGRILHTRGVMTILGVNRRPGRPGAFLARNSAHETFAVTKPVPVPEKVVNALLQSAAANGGRIPLQKSPDNEELEPLKCGQAVLVTDGPFAGMEGIVSWDQKERVRVLLDILGRSTPVMVDRELLSAAETT